MCALPQRPKKPIRNNRKPSLEHFEEATPKLAPKSSSAQNEIALSVISHSISLSAAASALDPEEYTQLQSREAPASDEVELVPQSESKPQGEQKSLSEPVLHPESGPRPKSDLAPAFTVSESEYTPSKDESESLATVPKPSPAPRDRIELLQEALREASVNRNELQPKSIVRVVSKRRKFGLRASLCPFNNQRSLRSLRSPRSPQKPQKPMREGARANYPGILSQLPPSLPEAALEPLIRRIEEGPAMRLTQEAVGHLQAAT